MQNLFITLFTGVLAVVAILQFIAMHRQANYMRDGLDATKKSAEAAGKAAEAAKRNAEALVNSERAWVLTDLVFSADLPAPAPTKSRILYGASEGRETISIDICLICRNDGSTPAWITHKQMHFRNLSVLPTSPDFSSVELFGDYMDRTLEPITVGGEAKHRFTLECGGPSEAAKTQIVYGFVKYRDVFGPDRETRFAYTVRGLQLLRLPGAEDYWEYNKYT